MLWQGCTDAGAETAGEGWSTEECSASMQIPDPFIKACVVQGLIPSVRTPMNIGIYYKCVHIAIRNGQ